MIGPDRLKCHVYSSGGHGTITVEQAVMNSCNPYMIHLALELGNESLQHINHFLVSVKQQV